MASSKLIDPGARRRAAATIRRVIDAARRSQRDSRHLWIIAGLIALAVIMPGILAIASGAIVIPLSDDSRSGGPSRRSTRPAGSSTPAGRS